MASLGFQLFDIGNMVYYKMRNTIAIGGQKGLLLSADVLYLRRADIFADQVEQDKSLDKLGAAILICLAYGYPDYAIILVTTLRDRHLIDNTQSALLLKELSSICHWSKPIPGFWNRDLMRRIASQMAAMLQNSDSRQVINNLGNGTGFMISRSVKS